jgi:hypothetical protein
MKLPQRSIKAVILNLLRGLMHRYKDQVLESFFELWIQESHDLNPRPEANMVQDRRKIIEMMIYLDINPVVFLNA